jgi:hypothetical protein
MAGRLARKQEPRRRLTDREFHTAFDAGLKELRELSRRFRETEDSRERKKFLLQGRRLRDDLTQLVFTGIETELITYDCFNDLTSLNKLINDAFDVGQEVLTREVAPGAKETAEQAPQVEEDPLHGQTITPPVSAFEEARAALRRAAELMDQDPAIVQDLLPEVRDVMKRVMDSPDVLTRKEVAEQLGKSCDRVKDFTEEGRLGVKVGSLNLYAKKQVDEFGELDRPTGRPKL